MEPWEQAIIIALISLVGSIGGSVGFWTFINKKVDRQDADAKLLTGIAHYKIVELGMRYIERGNITKDEYENLRTYLYEPYRQRGGNGTAEKIMKEVDKLEIIP